jgi:hypothetical protein
LPVIRLPKLIIRLLRIRLQITDGHKGLAYGFGCGHKAALRCQPAGSELLLRPWQREVEGRPFIDLALRAHAPAVAFDDAVDDGQPDARAFNQMKRIEMRSIGLDWERDRIGMGSIGFRE